MVSNKFWLVFAFCVFWFKVLKMFTGHGIVDQWYWSTVCKETWQYCSSFCYNTSNCWKWSDCQSGLGETLGSYAATLRYCGKLLGYHVFFNQVQSSVADMNCNYLVFAWRYLNESGLIKFLSLLLWLFLTGLLKFVFLKLLLTYDEILLLGQHLITALASSQLGFETTSWWVLI